jgi:hypothetical protein
MATAALLLAIVTPVRALADANTLLITVYPDARYEQARDANTRLVTVFPGPSPGSRDAITRLVTVYPNPSPGFRDAVTRLMTVFPNPSPGFRDAITRLLTVYPDTTLTWYKDANTRSYLIWYFLTPDAVSGDGEGIPTVFTVMPARPNPAVSVTSFRLGLPADGPVRLELYDATGRRVYDASPAERLRAGWHVLDVQTARLSNGVYFCRIEAGARTKKVKLVVQR